MEEESKERPSIDLDKLPSSIRDRLRRESSDVEKQNPNVEVGNPEERRRSGTFTITPEMRRRLEARQSSDKQSDQNKK